MNIQEIRQKYPQYDDLSDEQLLQGLHAKHYSDMPYEQFAGSLGVQNAVAPEEPGVLERAADTALGVADAALVVGSNFVSEPFAGLAGIAQSLNPFAEEGAGAEAVEGTRDLLSAQPRTEVGSNIVGALGDALEPVGEALSSLENYLGDNAYEATGSAALAAAAKTVPTAIMEVLGLKAGAMRKMAKEGKDFNKLVAGSVPSTDKLKDAARMTYKEIDDMGVRVKADHYAALASKVTRDTRGKGLDKQVTPAASRAVDRYNELIGQEVPLSEIEILREVAQGAAKNLTNPKEAMLGSMILDVTDQFLDRSGTDIFTRAPDGVNIGKRYKVARGLWGQARKGELLQEAIDAADLQASGLENGIRVQFRQILKNKRQKRFFNTEERAAMERVVKGTKGANLAKALGRLGISEGGATNILGAGLGAGGGLALGGMAAATPGALIGMVTIPAIGQVSRKLAQHLTMKNAKLATEVTRLGSDGKKIAKAYVDNVPKAERSADVLSELLAMPDIALDFVEGDDFVREAVELAKRRRALGTSAAVGASNEGLLKMNQKEVAVP